MSGYNGRSFVSSRFLILLLSISVATNVILITRLAYPKAWARLALSLHPVPPVTNADRIAGSRDAPITIIEYADFQCPFCAAMHQAMQAVVKEGNVRWVYRHYPLIDVHSRAFAAAEAAECAADQGKFWDFAGELFQRQNDLTQLPFDSVTRKVGVDHASFRTCMSAGKYNDVVIRQMREGRRLRIAGTPTYFINGKRFEGFRSVDDLRAAIAQARS